MLLKFQMSFKYWYIVDHMRTYVTLNVTTIYSKSNFKFYLREVSK